MLKIARSTAFFRRDYLFSKIGCLAIKIFTLFYIALDLCCILVVFILFMMDNTWQKFSGSSYWSKRRQIKKNVKIHMSTVDETLATQSSQVHNSTSIKMLMSKEKWCV